MKAVAGMSPPQQYNLWTMLQLDYMLNDHGICRSDSKATLWVRVRVNDKGICLAS